MKIIFILLTLFSFHFSLASLAGDWTGWGTWKFKGKGDGAQCSPMTMRWSENAGKIAIETGQFECDVVVMYLDKTEWSIKDGLLFDDDGKEVGSYDGQTFKVHMPSPNPQTMIHVSLKREANHYDYEEVWFNRVEKIYVIQGRFFTGSQ